MVKSLKTRRWVQCVFLSLVLIANLFFNNIGVVYAAVTGGTINFDTGGIAAPIGQINGLDFYGAETKGWMYDNEPNGVIPDGGRSATPNNGGADTGIAAVIKVVTPGDLFNISTLSLLNYDANTSITFTGYKNNNPFGSPVVINTTQYDNQFRSVTLKYNWH